MNAEDSIPLNVVKKVDNNIILPEVKLKVSNIKLIISLFVIFMFVVSDVFTNNIISKFGEDTLSGRNPTAWGVVLQGIFLIIFYILAVYLTENNIL
jgi:hypothetical protein